MLVVSFSPSSIAWRTHIRWAVGRLVRRSHQQPVATPPSTINRSPVVAPTQPDPPKRQPIPSEQQRPRFLGREPHDRPGSELPADSGPSDSSPDDIRSQPSPKKNAPLGPDPPKFTMPRFLPFRGRFRADPGPAVPNPDHVRFQPSPTKSAEFAEMFGSFLSSKDERTNILALSEPDARLFIEIIDRVCSSRMFIWRLF
jgi:hypothetical protein